jgi:hypothetical protein
MFLPQAAGMRTASAARAAMLSRWQDRIGRMTFTARFLGFWATVSLVLGFVGPAQADRIAHPTVVFAGLDKITGRIFTFDVAVNETVQFGTMQITPRVCYTRPATEEPLTTGFVEVEEVEAGQKLNRIFAGWMFAASPGLHGVEHPVYDVWLTDCRGGKEILPSPPASARNAPAQQPATPPSQRQPQPARPAPARDAAPSNAPNATPPLRSTIEVGPPPGMRPLAPPPQVLEGPRGTQPQQPNGHLPSASEAPIMMPPGSIPGGR